MNLQLANTQFNAERANEQAYQALQAAAESVNRPGAAAYFAKSATDERDHTRRAKDYIIDRGEKPIFDVVPALVPIDGDNYESMFAAALALEKANTVRLNAYWLAAEDVDEDPQTVAFLTNPDGEFPGFIAEQTASERELNDLLSKIRRVGPDGLETFDQWLQEQVEG